MPFAAGGHGFGRPAAGAGEAGMAYTCVMKPGLWSSFHNQACLPLANSLSVGFSFENRFSLKELSTRSACIIVPARRGAAGAFYSSFGYADYRRETVALASGLQLGPGLTAGVQTDCFIEKTAGSYSNSLKLTCEAGLIIDLSENVRAGIHLFNPVPNALRSTPMPSALRAGAGITTSTNLFAGFETEMITGNRINLKTGFEYTAGKNLRLRGGYSTIEPSFSFGLGCGIKEALIDLSFSTHPRLGITSCISLSFVVSGEK